MSTLITEHQRLISLNHHIIWVRSQNSKESKTLIVFFESFLRTTDRKKSARSDQNPDRVGLKRLQL